MNIAVIGGGSLGLLMSSYLSRKHRVTLYVRRTEQLDKIKQKGISLKLYENIEIARINVALFEQISEHDVYFVCVKQPHIDRVLPLLAKLDESSHIIFLQNGMGHLHKITALRPEISVGIVEHGAHRINDYEVNHLGVGTIKIAPYKTETINLENLQSQLHQEDFPIEIHTDWEPLLKTKLLINAVINPLTALFNVTNGMILTNIHIKNIAEKLTEETAYVLGFDYNWAWENVSRVAENTKDNTSSMLADILHNRETEIEAISGYLLRIIEKREIPFTYFIYEAILALQNRG